MSEQTLRQVVPDVTFRYHKSVVDAKRNPYGFVEFLFRKAAHLFVYGMLAVFAFVALLPYRGHVAAKAAFVLAAVAATALVDEWNQLQRGGRTGAIQDVFVDLTGAAVALLVVLLLVKSRRRAP
ncbi:hypothetical protein J31TS4_31690 [Paenibacillus sp. J31TS4]|nr:hypothetical protein J31TS4_31690 [Paenibacillus sp. J31TS4]